MSVTLPRRDFLKGLGATAGLSACKPDPQVNSGPGTLDTIVLCMMENRSFDHVFGSLSLLEGRAVDGLLSSHGNPDLDGNWIASFLSGGSCVSDPPHGWDASRLQMSDGNMGFVKAFQESRGGSGELVMGYLNRAQQPISYAMADRYALCQRWFSSLLTSTWPNRCYAHAAQNQGQFGNSFPEGGLYTCLTIWDLLDEAGISWSYYYTDLPMLALFGRFGDRLKPIEFFYQDAASGSLDQVVMVEPGAALNDDHPPHHPMLGQMFIGSIHNALATSPQWNRLMMLLYYDEAGGFFDHVVPGTAADERAAEGFDQLGFRIPAVLAGPWVKEAHLSDTVFDHTSPLAHIQAMFGLTSLTQRDAAANDLSSLIDEDRLARNEPMAPAELPVIELTEEEIFAECEETTSDFMFNGGQPELQAALREMGLGHLDRTHENWKRARFFMDKAVELGVCTIR